MKLVIEKCFSNDQMKILLLVLPYSIKNKVQGYTNDVGGRTGDVKFRL